MIPTLLTFLVVCCCVGAVTVLTVLLSRQRRPTGRRKLGRVPWGRSGDELGDFKFPDKLIEGRVVFSEPTRRNHSNIVWYGDLTSTDTGEHMPMREIQEEALRKFDRARNDYREGPEA